MTGPPLRADEQRLVAALLSYLEAIVAMHRLQGEASTVEGLSQANDLRNALLAAVSHDLRTPLASIKALASGWLEPDVDWSRADTHEFMRSIDAEADRLNKLVENLLDMSRLQSGALQLARRPAALDEIVPAALASLSERSAMSSSTSPRPSRRSMSTRRSSNERSRTSSTTRCGTRARTRRFGSKPRRWPAGSTCASSTAAAGFPLSQRERVFQPFQRLGDTASDTGVGLGLAVARGFVDAVGGELTVEDTPGGGVTMVIGLPLAIEVTTEERAS